jgi:outer membrane immunogenic protein
MMGDTRRSNPRNKGTVMRRSLAALWLIVLLSNAAAQEFELPALRGSTPYVPAPPTYTRWSGFYGGAQGGVSSAAIGFGAAPSNLIAEILRNTELENKFQVSQWPRIPSGSARSSNWGLFAGYNSQWDDVILGVEASYNRLRLANTSADSITRIVTLADQFNYTVTATSGASLSLNSYGTFRVRAGYDAGLAMPYLAAGLAIGQMTYSKFGTVSYPVPIYSLPPPIFPQLPPPTPPSFSATKSEGQKNAIAAGYSGAAGVDFLLLPNVFLRGEYEFVAFPMARMIMMTHNVHVGGALKF